MLCCGGSKKSKLHKSGSKSSSRKSSGHNNGNTTKNVYQPNAKYIELVKKAHANNVFEETKIIPTIFKYLSTNELLRVRSVSKLWNRFACEALRERLEGVVILQRGLSYYTKMMSCSNDIPIGKIFLNILDMDEAQPKAFFRILGHTVYFLILNLEGHSVIQFQSHLHYLQNMKQFSLNLFNREKDEDAPRKMTRRKTGANVQIIIEDYDESSVSKNSPARLHLPNLENLIVSCEENWKSNETLLLEHLIKGTPNLKNLNLLKWPFPAKCDLFEKSALSNLQFLTMTYITNAHLKSLAAKRLQLKSAEFSFDFDVEGPGLDKFLESVSSSLQYLRVDSKTNQELVFRLPTKMQHLVSIRLTTWVGPIWLDTVAGNGENLTKLQFINCNPGCITMKHHKSNSHVKYLAVCFGHYSTISPKLRSEVLKHFIQAFPSLECFMMKQVSDKTLGMILNSWPNLKTLRVTSGFGLTDSGLTGIPTAKLSKMTKLENRLACGCCLPFHVVDAKPDLEDVRQYSHIGKLADLVDLSIESEDGSHFPLTNFSLHLGVHELSKLESLKITCHNELGPHWCLRAIADNLPNLKELTVMDRAISHDRYAEDEVHYLLKRLPNLKLNLVRTNIANHSASSGF